MQRLGRGQISPSWPLRSDREWACLLEEALLEEAPDAVRRQTVSGLWWHPELLPLVPRCAPPSLKRMIRPLLRHLRYFLLLHGLLVQARRLCDRTGAANACQDASNSLLKSLLGASCLVICARYLSGTSHCLSRASTPAIWLWQSASH